MGLLESVHDTICRRDLLRSSDKVLVAVSGGPDSVALLYALKALGYDVHAAHMNHLLRGIESDEDEAYVRQFCKSLGVRLSVGRCDTAKVKIEQRLSTQEAARDARYAYLERLRVDLGSDKVSTGHNQDDQVETVLLNVMRGAGSDGLSGIAYRRGSLVRPLLDTPRVDVEAFCHGEGLDARHDSSNRSGHYTRNNVRNELLPYLERRFNTGIKKAVLRLSEISDEENEYMRAQARDWIAVRAQVPAAELRTAPVALQRRVLREWLRLRLSTELNGVSHTVIENIRNSLGSAFSITLPGGDHSVCCDGETLELRKVERPRETLPTVSVRLTAPGITLFHGQKIDIRAVPDGVDAGYLYARSWIAGDRMRLSGGSKKVQDVFTDAKVPRNLRQTYPLIMCGEEILAVPGIVTAARARGLDVLLSRAD